MSKKTSEIIERQVENKTIQQRSSDGYFNVTALCEAVEKNLDDYLKLQSTKNFLKQLSSDTGVPRSSLILSIKDSNQSESIWVHPKVALNIGQWVGEKYQALVSSWIYDWMLEKDFRMEYVTMKELKDIEEGKTSKKKKKEKEVPKGFEEKIKKTLEYNPNKKEK
ncbi:MAG TPA: hypothetical protein DIT04_04670 [Dysgonomonas sp.]|nr:hypothetical protein [Dysgonomonas sp.]